MFKTYFSAKHILDKGALINYVLSDRSDGKTFDCKVRALYDYKKNKAITVYVRRYKSELTASIYESFFDDVLFDTLPSKEKYRRDFEGWKFKGSKRGVQVKLPNSETWDWIVFFIPLTMSGKLKSQLDSYVHRIYTIDFDEYVPLDDRYAINEMTLLMELWKSIDRDRDSLQLIILGNRIVTFTPFFDYFDLHLQITQDKIRMYRDNTLAVQIYSNREHRNERKQSKFNKLVEGTDYDNYNAGGVLRALNLKVASHEGCTYVYSFKTQQGEGSVWSNGRQYVVSTYTRKDGFVVVDQMYNTGREEYVVTFGRFGQVLKRMYKTGQLYFESEQAYHIFEDILKKVWN